MTPDPLSESEAQAQRLLVVADLLGMTHDAFAHKYMTDAAFHAAVVVIDQLLPRAPDA